ncbi:hypothetical protein PUNSTDRAFT_143906 [Punctularia strigosozonata HHB-11173 SS5]|uniref:uncharacterized protein n=1 Tax=Punctularia strigosozonata (strain HHB-11173) TaxID=741275 RepID=UPI000441737C|nr:uncharacterized protein PUNSTDRAFT_143906 [Punctularia strigosozonata HHB-11173 SS5]EIN08267.1 hypothetical protein PUNSTDRAFT_143906 [Punctularia strigosozonata HHB-11173 SS5]
MDSRLTSSIPSAHIFADNSPQDTLGLLALTNVEHAFPGCNSVSDPIVPALQLNAMDILSSFMSMQGIEGQDNQQQPSEVQQGQGQGQSQQFNAQTPQALLEQQLKLTRLQQLQQLQNQIFQQQIELISNGGLANPLILLNQQGNNLSGGFPNPSHTVVNGDVGPSQRENPFHGLPTPVSSTELRAQNPGEFVSPLMLQYTDPNLPLPGLPRSSSHGQHQGQMHDFLGGTNPANPRHQELLPPIFGSGSNQHHVQPLTPDTFASQTHQNAFSGGSHHNLRQNMSHSAPADIVFRTTPPVPAEMEYEIDNVSPLTSPWFGATLSSGSGTVQAGGSATSKTTMKRGPSPTGGQQVRKRPATLKKAGAGRAASSKSAGSTPLLRSRSRKGSLSVSAAFNIGSGHDAPQDTPSPVDLSMPPPAAPNQSNSSNSSGNGDGLAQSALDKPVLPITPSTMLNIGRTSNSFDDISALPSGSQPAGVPQPPSPVLPLMPKGKGSHKLAEQKRRDSLKTSFDDLRVLLPPIPMPSEDGFAPTGEPILPGALPPRGPPKGGGEGPNRGVSKLQLLRCGNEYIKTLKGRVDRRDEEIERLRKEVRKLRLKAAGSGEAPIAEEDEEEVVDLEKDVDAVEKLGGLGVFGNAMSVGAEDGEDDGAE